VTITSLSTLSSSFWSRTRRAWPASINDQSHGRLNRISILSPSGGKRAPPRMLAKKESGAEKGAEE